MRSSLRKGKKGIEMLWLAAESMNSVSLLVEYGCKINLKTKASWENQIGRKDCVNSYLDIKRFDYQLISMRRMGLSLPGSQFFSMGLARSKLRPEVIALVMSLAWNRRSRG